MTILTSDDIERFGFARFDELLESVRGFYLRSDRNYSYLGTRGFGRPTDYNNRVLVLIDGHSMNDQTWGAAPMEDERAVRAVVRRTLERSGYRVLEAEDGHQGLAMVERHSDGLDAVVTDMMMRV